MNTEQPTTHEPLKDKVQNSLESAKESASSCCQTVRKETCQICESTSDAIRKNPIAYVAGAAFLGAAVCYLILESRTQPTFRERYVDGPLSGAGDSVSNSIHSAINSLKFW